MTNLEKFVLKERLVDKNGWQHYVYQVGECAIHSVYFRATTNWDRVIATTYLNDFTTTTQAFKCRQLTSIWKVPNFQYS